MRLIALLMLLIIWPCCGGALAETHTQSSSKFPGTNWSFVPPPGFVLQSLKTSTFKHPNGAAIVMLQTAPQNLELSDLGAVGSVLEVGTPNEVRLELAETTSVDGLPAILFNLRSTIRPVLMHNILIEGQGSNAIVYFTVPDSATGLDTNAIRAALLSFTEQRRSIAERLQDLPFTINEMAGMRVFDIVGAKLVYLTDGVGEQIDVNIEQPFAIVSVSPMKAGSTFEPERDLAEAAAQIGKFYSGTTIISQQVEQTAVGPVASVGFSRALLGNIVSVDGTAWMWTSNGNYLLVIAQNALNQPKDVVRIAKIRDGIAAKKP
jgi:hypothetical protein